MPILWHFRLGHPSLSRMSILQNVLPSFSAQCIDVCTIYPLAKQKRLPFPSHNNLCNEPFSLIHVDVWNPYSICTHDGFKFFLTIVDNATRSTWVYLMKDKLDVKHLLGCVCFNVKPLLEMFFCKHVCLVVTENWVKLKLFSMLTVK